MITTSNTLSSISSPLANKPNCHAFNTGWVLKYSRMASYIIPYSLLPFTQKNKENANPRILLVKNTL